MQCGFSVSNIFKSLIKHEQMRQLTSLVPQLVKNRLLHCTGDMGWGV